MLRFALAVLGADLGAVSDHVQEVQEVVVVVAVLAAVLAAVLVGLVYLAHLADLAGQMLQAHLVHLVCLEPLAVPEGLVLRQKLRMPATMLDCVHLPSPGSGVVGYTCPPCSGRFESACCEWPRPAVLQRPA